MSGADKKAERREKYEARNAEINAKRDDRLARIDAKRDDRLARIDAKKAERTGKLTGERESSESRPEVPVNTEKVDRSPKPSFRERMKAAADKAVAHAELHKYDAEFEDVRIDGTSLHVKKGGTWQVAECSAQVDHGANLQPRLTATRLAMTAGFALLLKKDRNKVYLMVETPGDAHMIELKAKKETDARKFAMQVNNAARHFSQG